MRRIGARVAGFVLAVACGLMLLAGMIDALGSSAPLMRALMTRFAPPASTGLPSGEYDGMTTMITRYLSGAVDECQYTWTDESGVTYLAFQAHEQQHMADCRALFVLDREVLLFSAMATAALMGACWALRDRRRAAQGFLAGSGALLAVALGVILWGVIDFDGLFILFHQLSFDNGLWLLDPATDLLIRLMPTRFFVTYAAILGGSWLGGMLLAMLLGWRVMKIRR